MPAVNLSDKYRRVFIGVDLQPWTQAAGIFRASWSAVDPSGLITISATLEILPTPQAPESLDPRANPTRWAPGTPVLIEVLNSLGNYVAHRMGRLFILSEPGLPGPGEGITLDLGCRLAYHDTFEYDADQSGITLGTAENMAVVAQRYLEANEIASANISLSAWPYTLAAPTPKDSGGSFTRVAGQLAYSSNFRYLYQSAAGVVVDAELDLTSISGSPTAVVTLGVNEIAYEPQRAEETPPDEVKAVGTGEQTGELNTTLPPTEIIGSKAPYSYDSGKIFGSVTCTGTGVIHRSTPVITIIVPEDGEGDIIYRVTVTDEAPGTSAFLDPEALTTGQHCSLISYKRTITERRFAQSGGVGGRLKSETRTTERRRFTLVTAEPSNLGGLSVALARTNRMLWEVVEQTVVTPTYDENDVIVRLEEAQSQAEIIFQPDSNNPYNLQVLRRDITSWEQQGDNTWQKTETTVLPKVFTSANPSGVNPFAQSVSGNTTVTGSGANQPPATEYWDGGVTRTQQAYEAVVPVDFYSTGRSTKRPPYQVPFGVSNDQMAEISRKHARLIVGRHLADYIELPVTDALHTADPLFQVDVVRTNGDTRHYLADACSWVMGPDSARVGVTGVWVAQTPFEGVTEPVLDIVIPQNVNHAGALSGFQMAANADPVLTITHAGQLSGFQMAANVTQPIDVTHAGQLSGFQMAATVGLENEVAHAGEMSGFQMAASADPVIEADHAGEMSGFQMSAEAAFGDIATHAAEMSGFEMSAAVDPVIAVNHAGLMSGFEMSAAAEPVNGLLNALAGWWEFDEASGNALDSHTSAVNLTQNGTVTSAAGIVGNSRSLTSSAATNFSSNNAIFNLGNTNFSAGIWVYPTTVTASGIVGIYDVSTNNRKWVLTISSGNRFDFTVSSDGTFNDGVTSRTITLSSNTITANNWYFLKAYHDADNNEVGLGLNDGSFVTASWANGIHTGGSTLFYVGRYGSTSIPLPFTGRVDNFTLHNRVLSGAEWDEMYNIGNGIAYPG